jgi:thiol-disulfide isomerase/thioredoxin
MGKSSIKYLLLIVLMFFGQISMAANKNQKVLLFFHAGYCHYCSGVAGSLVDIEKKYDIKIIASGLDKKVLPQFTNYLKGDALIRKFKIASVPTLIAIDFDKGQFEVLLEQYEDYDAIDAKVSAWINNA